VLEKNKRTEFNDRRLILCHEKVGGQKFLCLLSINIGGRVPPSRGFAITDFRW